MGVLGLFPGLGPLCRAANIYVSGLRKVVGVDASVWMHQLACAYVSDLVERADYTQLVIAIRQRAQFVIAKGHDSVLVFDGGRFRATS
jgi:hypothetical protein